jgi:plastin-1
VLDLLDAIRAGIVDPALVIPVAENGDYEDRRQNGMFGRFCSCCRRVNRLFFSLSLSAKLAISIARKMNALIFLVPEDIVDVRPRLV